MRWAPGGLIFPQKRPMEDITAQLFQKNAFMQHNIADTGLPKMQYLINAKFQLEHESFQLLKEKH